MKQRLKTEVIKMQAKLIDAVCRIWRLLQFNIIRDPYAITHVYFIHL